MMRYVIRRLLQMIPTMLGVILITFVLFNLVGGSPGRIMLGDKASARDLEAFDESRGFNRPLFWGRYGETRIYAQTDFSVSSGPWTGIPNVTGPEDGGGPGLRITGDAVVAVPLAFDLFPGHTYEWRMTFKKVPGSGEIALVAATNRIDLRELKSDRVTWRDRVDSGSRYRPQIVLGEGSQLLIERLECRRVNAHPWNSQWSHYIGNLFRLDFGWSHSAGQNVGSLLKQGIGPTLCLAAPILFVETILSVVFALVCAYFRDRFIDRAILVLSVTLMSVNYLVWIVAGQYWLGFKYGWFPVWGFESWHYLLLPVIVGVMHGLGPNVRFYRTVMLEEMHRDYVRTARAKGVSVSGVLFRHVLKNAMIPVITNVVLALPFLYTGSLLLETFFGIPGLGYLSVNAINSSDVDVVRAVVLIGSFLYLAANLLADLCYAWVDPRVKLT